jgi:hypothetical protein
MTDDTTELDRLDALCAEGIMGWDLSKRTIDLFWQPTRNISQAFEVLEKFKHFRINSTVSGPIEAVIFDEDWKLIQNSCASTAPLAIVKACLKAKGLM